MNECLSLLREWGSAAAFAHPEFSDQEWAEANVLWEELGRPLDQGPVEPSCPTCGRR